MLRLLVLAIAIVLVGTMPVSAIDKYDAGSTFNHARCCTQYYKPPMFSPLHPPNGGWDPDGGCTSERCLRQLLVSDDARRCWQTGGVLFWEDRGTGCVPRLREIRLPQEVQINLQKVDSEMYKAANICLRHGGGVQTAKGRITCAAIDGRYGYAVRVPKPNAETTNSDAGAHK